jgi:hypothetical protein
MKKPEKISPKGILEIGIGPKEYKIPVMKDIIPMSKTNQSVNKNKENPVKIAIESIVKITNLA